MVAARLHVALAPAATAATAATAAAAAAADMGIPAEAATAATAAAAARLQVALAPAATAANAGHQMQLVAQSHKEVAASELVVASYRCSTLNDILVQDYPQPSSF